MSDELKKISSPPILDLPKPCDMAWEAMQRGEDGKRFCDACSTHVHDLSSMTRRDALALLVETDWGICVNYEVDEQGQMLFQPEPPTRLQLQIEGARRLLAAAAILPVALASTACDEHPLRTGGEPVAIHHEAQAQGVAQDVIDTSTTTAQLEQGSGLKVTAPGKDDSEETDKPACDGIEDPVEPKLDIPKAEPKHQRLGGAPVAHKPHLDTSPAPSDTKTP